MLRDRIRRHCLQRDQGDDRSPRRVSYGLKNVSFHDRQQIMQPNGCRYKLDRTILRMKLRFEF